MLVRDFLDVNGLSFDLSTPETLIGDIEFLNVVFDTVRAIFVLADTTGIAMRKKLNDVK
jgi:hypothetical protein